MIENKHQYEITKQQVRHFEKALSLHDQHAQNVTADKQALHTLQRNALVSQLDDLRQEATDYEKSVFPDIPQNLWVRIVNGRVIETFTNHQDANKCEDQENIYCYALED